MINFNTAPESYLNCEHVAILWIAPPPFFFFFLCLLIFICVYLLAWCDRLLHCIPSCVGEVERVMVCYTHSWRSNSLCFCQLVSVPGQCVCYSNLWLDPIFAMTIHWTNAIFAIGFPWLLLFVSICILLIITHFLPLELQSVKTTYL